MGVVGPGEGVGALPGGVGLEPVGSAVAGAEIVRDADGGDAGAVVSGIGSEAGDAEFGAGVFEVIGVPIIHRVSVHGLAAEVDIVNHVGGDGLGPADDPIGGAHGSGGGLIRIGSAQEDGFVDPSVAEEEASFFAEVVIDAVDGLVPVVVIGIDGGDVVRDARKVGLREPLEEAQRLLGEHGSGNDVARDGRFGAGVEELFGDLGEVTGAHEGREGGGEGGGGADDAEAFVIGHEECFVAAVEEFRDDDGAANFKAELILMERRFGGGGGKEEGSGVHVAIAEKFEECAVEGVSAALS